MAQGKVAPVKARIKANPFERSGRPASSSRSGGKSAKKKPAKTSRKSSSKRAAHGSSKVAAVRLAPLLPRVTVPRVTLPEIAIPRVLKQWVGAGVLLVLVGLSLWTLYPAFAQRMAQRRQMDRLQRELSGVKQENEGLRYEIGRLYTKTYIEEIARSDLGLIKPGEIPYLVVPVKPKPKPKPGPKGTPSQTRRLAKAASGKRRAAARVPRGKTGKAGTGTALNSTRPSTQVSMISAPAGGSSGAKSQAGARAKGRAGGLAGWWAAIQGWLRSLLE